MMMATGLAANEMLLGKGPTRRRKTKARIIDSGPVPASRERPTAADYLRVPLRIPRRAPALRPSGSGDDVGGQLVLDEADAVAQHQLALLEALDLQDVGTGRDLQSSRSPRRDRGAPAAAAPVAPAVRVLPARSLPLPNPPWPAPASPMPPISSSDQNTTIAGANACCVVCEPIVKELRHLELLGPIPLVREGFAIL